MDTILTYGFGLLLVAIAAYLAREVWIYVGQYRTISDIDPSGSSTLAPGESATLLGEVRVQEPVSEAESGRPAAGAGVNGGIGASGVGSGGVVGETDGAVADDVAVDSDADGNEFSSAGTDAVGDDEDGDTALLAWRVRRRKRKRRSGRSSGRSGRRYRWKTEDGGLDVGRFAVQSPAGTVDVDPDAARTLLPGGWGADDPWESKGLHLGDPDERTRIDDARDFGPDMPINIDIGPFSTGERSRLEVNRVSHDDEVLVHGELTETDGELAITDGGAASFVLGTGSLGDVIGELRAKIAKNALFVLVLLVFAGAIFAGFADGFEFSF